MVNIWRSLRDKLPVAIGIAVMLLLLLPHGVDDGCDVSKIDLNN